MLIKIKIGYGCEAYSSASKTTLRKLYPIQNIAIRIATGAFKTSLIISLQSEADIKSLEICGGRLGVPLIHLSVYICWSYRMVALMLCYNSMAPSSYKDISASAICHL